MFSLSSYFDGIKITSWLKNVLSGHKDQIVKVISDQASQEIDRLDQTPNAAGEPTITVADAKKAIGAAALTTHDLHAAAVESLPAVDAPDAPDAPDKPDAPDAV